MTDTDDNDSNSILDELNFTRLVAISFALSVLLTAGTGVALAAGDTDKGIDSNDSLFCKKTDSAYSDSNGNFQYQKGTWATNASSITDDYNGAVHTHIGSAIETLVQLMFALGIVGVFIVWQGSAIGSIVTMDRSQKRKLKNYRGSALKSFAILLLIGPIFTVLQTAMSLQSAGCIGLSPF